jgi:hypothetical protein
MKILPYPPGPVIFGSFYFNGQKEGRNHQSNRIIESHDYISNKRVQ